MTTTTATYTVHLYDTADEIGTVELTPEQFADYLAAADGDAKVCRLDALPGEPDVSDDVDGSTAVYLME